MSGDRSRSARTLDRLIRAYQHLTAGRPPSCRFYPTCSRYAREAIAAHGALSGSWLALRRLGRCHPLGGHGYDPVPDGLRSRRSSQRRSSQRRSFEHRLRGADPC